MILHAGDIGELWVLDRLGDLAPVVAVHGNDETLAAQAALPDQQLMPGPGNVSYSGIAMIRIRSSSKATVPITGTKF